MESKAKANPKEPLTASGLGHAKRRFADDQGQGKPLIGGM